MKQDRRIRKSRNAIKKALITLMHRKSVSLITISELCQLADINRSTFYSNYESMNDCLTDLHKDLFDAMQLFDQNKQLDDHNQTEFRLSVITKMMKYIITNKDVVKVLFTNNENNLLEQNVENYFKEQYKINKRHIQEYYSFLYSVSGSFSVLKQWVKEDFPCSPEEVAKIIILISPKKEV